MFLHFALFAPLDLLQKRLAEVQILVLHSRKHTHQCKARISRTTVDIVGELKYKEWP